MTDLQASSRVWVDTLGPEAALWQHFRFKRSADPRQDWLLELPFLMLDQVTVFQRDRTGRWTSQTAGDTVPVSSWPEPGRHAQFHLALEDETAHDVYVRIAHVTPAHFPVNAMAARLIAAGLMPLKGLKPEVILQFHVAAVLFSEKLMDGPELSRALEAKLAGMAARTRRPMRFLDPELTRPMSLAVDSGFDEADGHSQPS